MNLVIGATGVLGGEICRQLRQAGKPVRALTRATADPLKVEQLKCSGATLIQGDLKDRASLDAACRGVATVITTASTTFSRQAGDSIQTVDLEGQVRLVDAAKAAGVSRFVYVSYSHQINVDCPLTTAKRSVEAHLQRSGMTYTILAPSVFMEVWLSPALGFDPAKARARIYGSGRNPISWISLGDVARFAALSVDQPSARNATIESGGPAALSPLEVVRIFEQVGGRAFRVEHVDEKTLRDQRATATDPLQQSFAALMLAYAQGDAIDMTQTLRTFPLKLLSVSDYARRTLAPTTRPAS
ncbi:MAG: SDR family oxidoreductase [Bacillati bacterium ANGP1]|uniref:SDR family oxidoreductase n=1 Tax=Candidatus Segetimicrobium genomatis TaxID=2569760 RepID=A0A537J1E2_9BACT|nr:MAG: SDR family oxidoreductase [Terrabacteria group bacterium ANGP1]